MWVAQNKTSFLSTASGKPNSRLRPSSGYCSSFGFTSVVWPWSEGNKKRRKKREPFLGTLPPQKKRGGGGEQGATDQVSYASQHGAPEDALEGGVPGQNALLDGLVVDLRHRLVDHLAFSLQKNSGQTRKKTRPELGPQAKGPPKKKTKGGANFWGSLKRDTQLIERNIMTGSLLSDWVSELRVEGVSVGGGGGERARSLVSRFPRCMLHVFPLRLQSDP